MTKYCVYFYGDILGYKDLLARNSVKSIERKLTDSLLDVQYLVREKQRKNEARRKSLRSEHPKLRKFFSWAAQGTFSHYFAFDTLLLFYKDIFHDTLLMRMQEFFLLSSSIYLMLLAKHNIKLRGVIGLTRHYLLENDLLILKEIDRCYSLEKSQEWAGVIVDIPNFLQYDCSRGVASEDEFVFYNVPLKSGKTEHPVLNPINKHTVSLLKEKSLSLTSVLSQLERESKRKALDESAKNKVTNTREFLVFCREHYENSIEREKMFGDEIGAPERVP
jgi:hypothetical protein